MTADAAVTPPEIVVEQVARAAPSFVRLADGTVWPDPTDPNEIGWKLRYGTPTKADLLVAASAFTAYRELVMQTARRRDDVIRQFRADRVTDLRAAAAPEEGR